jgi:hypothetical protein
VEAISVGDGDFRPFWLDGVVFGEDFDFIARQNANDFDGIADHVGGALLALGTRRETGSHMPTSAASAATVQRRAGSRWIAAIAAPTCSRISGRSSSCPQLRSTTTSSGGRRARRYGQPSFPSKPSRAVAITRSPAIGALYMQNPVPEEGEPFSPDRIGVKATAEDVFLWVRAWDPQARILAVQHRSSA